MVTYTYDTLLERIKNNAEDGYAGSEFENELPYMVDSAERRLTRELDAFGFMVKTTAVLTAGEYLVAKPSALETTQSLWVLNSEGYSPIYLRTIEYVKDYWPIPTSVGPTPLYYANVDENYFYLVPTASANTTVELNYTARPPALSTSTSVNYFTNYTPDLLFFACMVEACLFQKSADQAAVWNQRYGDELVRVQNRNRRQRQDAQQVPTSPQGGGNLVSKGAN